ncbi:ABC transporter ATP-binding protein [Corynebacterium pelargi]|uniref:Putative siderophore transport system ATP-binding protein YusV n=1 Tax=Corynebacterium pelargi TaxID=1471400 RepID=A0A410WB24_9CORY|nr:ABC transporter ATP-binding protein [Corynebacterium pelargi]QAU53140.1 putative siderophore transport system ATP-binding protein YusV [Corynebacterium pelargi]GGG74623.1 ABC transporter [Corynebacterium pelargi]
MPTHHSSVAASVAPPHDQAAAIAVRDLVAGYGRGARAKEILHSVDVDIRPGTFTVIVGPNACGKSTLLKTMARLLPVASGQIDIHGRSLEAYGTKELARTMSFLPQSPLTPESIVVEDLVGRGRYPHQGLVRQWSQADEAAVEAAMVQAGVDNLRGRVVQELSGGQRQRVWLALVLAQQTPIVLLDEPTTYLDITHQLQVLDVAQELQRSGKTVVAVLHELSLAFRYATDLIVMKQGRVFAAGRVDEVVTPELVSEVYDVDCDLVLDPRTSRPILVPHPRG